MLDGSQSIGRCRKGCLLGVCSPIIPEVSTLCDLTHPRISSEAEYIGYHVVPGSQVCSTSGAALWRRLPYHHD